MPLEAVHEVEGRLRAAGVPSPRVDAEILVADVLGLARSELYSSGRPVTAFETERLDELVGRRLRREPLAYILGEWGFRRLLLEGRRPGADPQARDRGRRRALPRHPRRARRAARSRRGRRLGRDRARNRRRARRSPGRRRRQLRAGAVPGPGEPGARRSERPRPPRPGRPALRGRGVFRPRRLEPAVRLARGVRDASARDPPLRALRSRGRRRRRREGRRRRASGSCGRGAASSSSAGTGKRPGSRRPSGRSATPRSWRHLDLAGRDRVVEGSWSGS